MRYHILNLSSTRFKYINLAHVFRDYNLAIFLIFAVLQLWRIEY